jgi:beta-lactamase regulating signal transducer with metallopeptidase domain
MMERLLVECAVRALLLIGLAGTTLYAMRVKDAAAKHQVWTGVMALMLFLPVWTMWGPKVNLRVLPPLPSVSATGPIVAIAGIQTTTTQSPRFSIWELFLLSVYLLGFILLAIRLVLGTVQTHRLARRAVLQNGVRTSPLCISPVTVGFLRPIVIFPQNWQEWEKSRFQSILTHEEEHARRHDAVTQWFALLNRAVFWFHPAAWWLERTLSGLAEEACDDTVLVRGHNPREYAECLLDLARSVSRSGARLNVVGMAAPGGFLRRRLHKIIEVGPQPRTSGAWMGFVATVCAVTCAVVATGTVGHARPKLSTANQNASQSSTTHPATTFVLDDVKIEGEVPDRDKVQQEVLKQLQGKEYKDVNELASTVAEVGVRSYFQQRGYFKVVVHDPTTQPIGIRDGKQQVLVNVPVTVGEQYRLGTIIFRNAVAGTALSIPPKTLREQFNLGQNDLFSVAKIRTGLEKLQALYKSRGYPEAVPVPQTEIDDKTHVINVVIQVAEKPDKT